MNFFTTLLLIYFSTFLFTTIISASISSHSIHTPQDDPITPAGSIKVLLETTWEANTGIVLRFNFTTKPTYSSIIFGYDVVATTEETGCNALSSVPSHSFFVTTWDHQQSSQTRNCIHADTQEPVGHITPNTNACNQNDVFVFNFLSDEIRDAAVKPADIIECFLYLPEPTIFVLPEEGDDPAPPPSLADITIRTSMPLKIISPPDLILLFPVSFQEITSQAQTNALLPRAFFNHYQQRIDLFELWFVQIPSQSSIPIGLYASADVDLKVNLFEDLFIMSLQDRIEASTAFNYQCLRNAARLYFPVSNSLQMGEELRAHQTAIHYPPTTPVQPFETLVASSPSFQIKSSHPSFTTTSTPTTITPTTNLFLNTNDMTDQTFVCQFLFPGLPSTNQYTFVFGDQTLQTVQNALDLRNKLVSIDENFNGQAVYPPPETQTPDPFILSPQSLTPTNFTIQQTPLTHYKYTHTIQFQLPITIFTEQIFTISLERPSQTIFNTQDLWFEIVNTSDDIRAELVETIESSMSLYVPPTPSPSPTPTPSPTPSPTPPSPPTPPETTTAEIIDPQTDPIVHFIHTTQTPTIPTQNSVIKIQYLQELSEEWNKHWRVYNSDIYSPAANQYNHHPAPPTPPEVASKITTISINTYVPISTDNTGFDLYGTLFTVIKSSSQISSTKRIVYNPENPLQLSYRPVIDQTTVIAETIMDLTTNTNWTFQVGFTMDSLSIPFAPPNGARDSNFDDASSRANIHDFGVGDTVLLTGLYSSPIQSPSQVFPQCTLYKKAADPTPAPNDGLSFSTTDTITTVPRQFAKWHTQQTDKGIAYPFNPNNVQVQGQYWRQWVTITGGYTNTDSFTIECTQPLTNGPKSTALYTNSIDVSIEITSTHTFRWYMHPLSRSIVKTISYPIADEFNLDASPTPETDILNKKSTPVAFKISGPSILAVENNVAFTPTIFELYFTNALFRLQNMQYTIPPATEDDEETAVIPFSTLQQTDIMLLTNFRQEWMNSYNAQILFSPFNSFSIFGVSPSSFGSMIMGIDENFFLTNNIDLKTLPWQDLIDNAETSSSNPTQLALYPLSLLPLDTTYIDDPATAIPLYWYYIHCQYEIGTNANIDIGNTSLLPEFCPTAIGQQFSLIQQCKYDPLITQEYRGINPEQCGAQISNSQFREMQAFWGRRNNNAFSLPFGLALSLSFLFTLFLI